MGPLHPTSRIFGLQSLAVVWPIQLLHAQLAGADANGSLGMGGLGTALSLAKKGFKNIYLFETASNLGFVGAGIQMAPNMVRILDRLGCWPGIEKDSTKVVGSSIRRE
jgi:hypothetical protein